MRSSMGSGVAGRAIVLALIAVCATSAHTATAGAAPTLPTISAPSADNVGPTIASLQAQIDPHEADTSYRFEYGTTTAYGNVVPVEGADIGSGAENVTVTQALAGLQPDTTYHYRVVAANSQGTATTEAQTFSTFGVSSFHVAITNADGSSDLQAGSTPYEMTAAITMAVNDNGSGEPIPAGAAKDQSIELPPGLIGNPNALPRCPRSMLTAGDGFGASRCPADTQVGVLTITPASGSEITLPVYNLLPPAGVAAQFGVFALLFPITMDVSLGAGSDYATTVSLTNLSQVLQTTDTILTLWGVPANPSHDPDRGSCLTTSGTSNGSCPSGAPPRSFLTLPTACGSPLTFGLRSDSWEQPGNFVTAASTVEDTAGNAGEVLGCERLAFNPTIGVQADTTVADESTGLTIDLASSPQEPGSLATAGLRDAEVTLPEGMTINPAAGDGLGACTPGQIALTSASAAACPDSSEIGTAEAQTPLVSDPLTGSIYLAQPDENPFGALLAVYVVAEGDGLAVKLPVEFVADPLTGRLSIKLDGVPQLPFTDFKLKLNGGSRAVLASPADCGTFTTVAQLTPYSAPQSGPPLSGSSSFVLDSGCASSFAPSFRAGATTATAGENTGFTLQLARDDDQQDIESFAVTMPAGLLANLGSVPTCEAAQAATGACDPVSRVGSAIIATGAGARPLYLSGNVFLTGPYREAPFGLAIVVPAVVGPLDLGVVTVRAQVFLASSDARLKVVSDPLPQILDGIPLRLRAVDLTIDRSGFLFNPTDCTRGMAVGTIESTAGVSAALSTPFQVTGCRDLVFTPQLSATIQAHPRKQGDGAAMRVAITTRAHDQANMHALTIDLPNGVLPRLTAIQRACRASAFLVDPAACPAGSAVGHATVATAILASPMSGPIYLVSRGGAAYPELRTVLQGEGISVEVDGVMKISKAKVISATFAAIPDVPIHMFTLELPRGPDSLLGLTRNLCRSAVRMSYAIVGYNGARVARRARVHVTGCLERHASRPTSRR